MPKDIGPLKALEKMRMLDATSPKNPAALTAEDLAELQSMPVTDQLELMFRIMLHSNLATSCMAESIANIAMELEMTNSNKETRQ